MPELPDITAYLDALAARVLGQRLERIEISTPFLLRTVTPAPADAEGHAVTALRRLGKRICIGFDNDVWLVLHLMIAGRLHWNRRGARPLACFRFSSGALTLTEAGSRRRASLHIVQGPAGLASLDPGGLEPLDCTSDQFAAALTRENHTLKRVLTDPRAFSGIGNAYSDEILHRARLSPVALTSRLTPEEIQRLHQAVRQTLTGWTERLKAEAAGAFPEKVTAFREGMAVHGRYGQPCPDCGAKVARIRYAENETDYCPRCQTGGRLLADRALSRLLGADWPRSIDES
jgi:formamidopyrimidine-DNA glycosylase